MSVITPPAGLLVTRQTWQQQRNDYAFRSVFGSQGLEVAAPVWLSSLEIPPMIDTDPNVGVWQGILLGLDGQVNQLELWNLVRPAPLGTIRGSITLHGNHAQSANTLSIVEATQPFKTIQAGDYFGLGSGTTQQVVIATSNATADSSGIVTFSIKSPLRNAFSSGAVVTWDKPKALFRQRANAGGWDYSGAWMVNGLRLDLIEDWRPSA